MNSIDQRLTIFLENATNLARQLADLYSLRERVRSAELSLSQRAARAPATVGIRGERQERVFHMRPRER